MPDAWSVRTLSREHDRRRFDCGVAALNEYLHHFARQHQDSGVARSFVAVAEGDPGRILGYYSLAVGSIAKADLPLHAARRLPRFPLPIARLARLAVDISRQKQGLGDHLLMDALFRISRVADEIGVFAVLIDAKNDHAKRFYQRYEFESLPSHPLTLWLPIAAVKRLFTL